MVDTVLLVAGLVLLLGCADLLIRGASGLARAMGVPPLVIGLTVVAFGTSAPELAINLMSAASGETALAFGNVVGSCMVNIGFVLAVTALVRPLDVEVSVISREMPILLLGVAAVLVLAADRMLGAGTLPTLARQDGIILLLLFGVFLYHTAYTVVSRRSSDALVKEVQETQAQAGEAKRRPAIDALYTLVGLVGVAGGGRMVVLGAVGIATRLGMSETVIGLTIVSLGTTLPELVTGITAARKGLSDIAVGNVVGSCIFNLLLIGGLVSTITPVPVPQGGGCDLLMLAALATLMLPICIRGGRKVTRVEGVVLLGLYLAYAVARVVMTQGTD